MTEAVQRKDWMEVVRLMKRDHRRELPQELRRWAVHETSKLCHDPVCLRLLVTHCDGELRDIAINNMVTRGMWSVVGEALRRGMSDSQYRWAIDEACKHASDDEFIDYILPRCADNQLDSVLKTLVERGMWGSVGMALERSVSYPHGRAHDEACRRISEQDITDDTLRRRTDNQLDSVLTPLVERGLWSSVGTVLQRGVSDSKHRWAIDEACKHASDEKIRGYILLHCTEDQLASVLTQLVKRSLWKSVGMVLRQGVSDSHHTWAIDMACKQATDEEITKYILPQCTGSQLDSVLAPLVERCLWHVVGILLERGVSGPQHIWAIVEACKHASDEEIIGNILPHCADNQLDYVLASLVERGLWICVGTVLERGVSDSQHRWLINESCKHASDDDISYYILLHCAGSQLDSVLTPLVERGLWSSIEKVLQRGVSDSQHRWAIDEACKRASEKETIHSILPHFADNQLDSVLTRLVERGLWEAVATVLQRGVNDSQRRWVIDEACKHASDKELVDNILPLSVDSQLDFVLPQLVERGLWKAVKTLLERGAGSDSQCRWAINEVCNRADNADVELCLQPFLTRNSLPQFLYDGANYLLTQLIKRDLWEDAATLLHGVVCETLGRWAVVEDNTEPDDAAFWIMVMNPWYGVRDLCELCQIVRRLKQTWLNRSQRLRGLSNELCEVLVGSVLESVFEAWFITQERRKEYKSTTDPSELVLQILSETTDDTDSVVRKYTEFSEENKYGDRKHLFYAVNFIKCLIKHYYTQRIGTSSSEVVLVILATVPVVPDVQSVALRVLLRHKRWDIISHACLTHVWEQVRRQLFQAAVEQRQWSIVKRWADHSLYYDQRGWALEEAFQQKQWDVFLLLADYGLVQSELMCVHYRLAKYANWDTVRQLFERGGDVTDVKELLTGPKSRKAAYDKDDALKRQQRVFELGRIESDFNARRTALKTLKRAAKQGDWSVVLFSLQRTPVEHLIHLALKAAVASGVWHVVRQLIKLGIDDAQRDSLFTRMVKQRQWGGLHGAVRAGCERGAVSGCSARADGHGPVDAGGQGDDVRRGRCRETTGDAACHGEEAGDCSVAMRHHHARRPAVCGRTERIIRGGIQP